MLATMNRLKEFCRISRYMSDLSLHVILAPAYPSLSIIDRKSLSSHDTLAPSHTSLPDPELLTNNFELGTQTIECISTHRFLKRLEGIFSNTCGSPHVHAFRHGFRRLSFVAKCGNHSMMKSITASEFPHSGSSATTCGRRCGQ